MNIKELLTLKPVVTNKIGGVLSKAAIIIWYVVLVLAFLELVPLLGMLFDMNLSGFIFGLAAWLGYFLLARIACEALAALKK
ncbi:MAG: hypothetical protein J6Y85_03020 [Alphaproteobacteria bacterium]|nr:hypothetical protein [Alphaproteobacteria bacterium]